MFARALVVLTGIAALALNAGAQVPGAPVLQNAFSNPGLAVAADFGGGGGQSFYGAAAALGMGRLQISGAAGAQRGNGTTRGAYGARLAASLWSSAGHALGVGAFAGIGGAPRAELAGVVANPATVIVPVGISLGYQRPIGASRGVSVYASPLYRWVRTDNGVVSSAGSMRLSLGLDFALTQSIGATLGSELGRGNGASGASTMGFALTFVPGRR
jgi:hypothetical protein